MSNPSNRGELLHRPHVYVKRKDGSSGYEPAPESIFCCACNAVHDAPVCPLVMKGVPSAADLDAVAAEQLVREKTVVAYDLVTKKPVQVNTATGEVSALPEHSA